jgi:hypothetical protein
MMQIGTQILISLLNLYRMVNLWREMILNALLLSLTKTFQELLASNKLMSKPLEPKELLQSRLKELMEAMGKYLAKSEPNLSQH